MKTLVKRVLLPAFCALLLLSALALPARAAALDEILLYEITVDVNEDGALRMLYHIDWKVLDSDAEGPLAWVQIGIPNRNYISLEGRSPAVDKISYSSGYARIDLDRAYYAGEVAEIEFELIQDYMYQVDLLAEGETAYRFTPGWFDGIQVDELTIRWNADKALSQSPDCLIRDGYFTWTRPLAPGETFTVTVAYPNDAFAFDLSKTIGEESGGEDDDYAVLGGLIVLVILFFALRAIFRAVRGPFRRTANFSGGGTEKKITRTKIVYYPECQGCGAARPEGMSNCPYCGRSFIKSEEVIKETDIPKEEKALRGKTTDGLYRYASQPDTYVRVNVVNVPAARHAYASSRGSSSSRGSGGGSCACASCASSCACACACACAGGGRAGCSVKDFYDTGLQLRQLEPRRKRS